MIIALADATSATSGGKAGVLGALWRAGLPVPPGFVVPGQDPVRGLRDGLARGLAGLGDPVVAVRSSASNEDTATFSGAGSYATVLAVRGVDQVLAAVRSCRASVASPRAVDLPSPGGVVEMAVLVQVLVDAEVSGVMFTPTQPTEDTRIEASWGLGPSVVGGTVSPDTYRVAADGAITRHITTKGTRLDRRGGGVRARTVPVDARDRPTLDDRTARRLAALGARIAGCLGPGQDVEWAIADGRIAILQSRPITAALPAPLPSGVTEQASAGVAGEGGGTLTGTPGSPGTVTGPARIVHGPEDFGRVRPGDVLVCPYTDPAWTPLLRVVAGVVTETGGVLSHAAIVARERGVPAVLGVPGATCQLPDGVMITLDGRLGTVATHERKD